MADIRHALQLLRRRLLEGSGRAAVEQRRAAFEQGAAPEPVQGLLRKVALHPYRVTDEDVAAVRASGLSEDQIFELVVCAAVGQACRQHDSAMAALEAAAGRA